MKSFLEKHRLPIILGIVMLECMLLGSIGYAVLEIYSTRNVLGATHIVTLKKEDLMFPPDTPFDQFYEPKAGSIIHEDPPWGTPSATYSITPSGFNQRRDYDIQKEDGIFRIITLGDSFTYGLYVDTPDNWPTQLEDLLNQQATCSAVKRYEVINLGVQGYDLVFAGYRYQLRGMAYHPDVVVWLINAHNFYMMPQLFKPRADELRKSVTREDVETAAKHGAYGVPWLQAYKEVIGDSDAVKTKVVHQEEAALDEFSANFTGPLFLATLNVPESYKSLVSDYQKKRVHPTYLFDTTNIFSNPDALVPDLHPNRKGHTILAHDIYTQLVRANMLPCK